MLLLSWLVVLVLGLEERLAILDADLRDDCNRSEFFAVVQQVVAVGVLEDLPRFATLVNHLVAISHTRLHSLVGDGVARVVWALDLVGCANVAAVGLDALAWLEEVADDLVKCLDVRPRTGGVRSIDPHEVPPEDTHPDLVSESRLPCVLVGPKGVPRDCSPRLRDPKVRPVDGHQAAVVDITFLAPFEVDL